MVGGHSVSRDTWWRNGGVLDAYIDIETTGLGFSHEITVIGIGLSDETGLRVVQLYDDDLTAGRLSDLLRGVKTTFTFNGSRFDYPFVQRRLGVDIQGLAKHRDLMLECWRQGLYGGFKAVERALGIPRVLQDMNGLKAVELWWQYKSDRDEQALDTLLAYNREDVANLLVLRSALAQRRRVPRAQR